MKEEDLQLIYESKNSIIYRSVDSENNIPISIKVLRADYPTPQQIELFKNEYKLLKNSQIEGVSKILKYDKFVCSQQFSGSGKNALFFEFIEGKTLREYSKEKHSLTSRIEIAAKIAKILGDIHLNGIIHRDINSANILINTAYDVFIIDFGIATKTNLNTQNLDNQEIMQGTLNYISPEQTGRMNRIVDHRTDLYSFGVTLYELFTGRLPFESSDSLELVHLHIAKQATPPHELVSGIPKILSDIILKLLSKNAEDRYQSAIGLQFDLERCLIKVRQTDDEALNELHFELAQNDVSTNFQLSQKLYGKDQELEQLSELFDNVVSCRMWQKVALVSGRSGVGKTMLINELQKKISQKNGYFGIGKSDFYQQNIPYHPITQALNQFAEMLLTESEQRLRVWRNKLRFAMGEVGKIITDLSPAMEKVMGEMPNLEELEGKDEQNRFIFAFRTFIKTISQQGFPVVFFVDDIQWIDTPSLNLLQTLALDRECFGFFCIAAYRPEEIKESHPLLQFKEVATDVPTIEIHDFTLDETIEFVGDSLNHSVGYSELAKIIYTKTHGNAFFIGQFLQTLYQKGKLKPKIERNKKINQSQLMYCAWQWNLTEVEQVDFTDNVLDLMSSIVEQLPNETQNVIRIASCFGNEFTTSLLSKVLQKNQDEVAQAVENLLQAGLIQIKQNKHNEKELYYKFSHFRIQDVVYQLIPDEERKTIHFDIGKLLIENISKNKQGERIFTTVKHWNIARDLVMQKHENGLLSDLNRLAGNRAKASGAYKAALEYYTIGLEISSGLANDHDSLWKKEYNETLFFHTSIAEMAFLSGNFDLCYTSVDEVLKYAQDVYDKVKVYEIKILAKTAQQKLIESIHVGIDALKLLGINLPKEPKKIHIALAFIPNKIRFINETPEKIMKYPVMQDKRGMAIVRLIRAIGPPTYVALNNLVPLLCFNVVRLYKKYGLTIDSPSIYATYGLIHSAIGDYNESYKYAKLSEKLIERFHGTKYKSFGILLSNDFIVPWKEPLRSTFVPLRQGFKAGLESGDHNAAAWCSFVYCFHAFFAGMNLDELVKEMNTSNQSIEAIKEEAILLLGHLYQQAVLNLLGKNENPQMLVGEVYDETVSFEVHQKANDENTILNFYYLKAYLAYTLKNYEAATLNIEKAYAMASEFKGAYNYPCIIFYDALIHLATYPQQTKSQQSKTKSRVKKSISLHKNWTKHCPVNHLHRYNLLIAEWKRVSNQEHISEYYDSAIEAAHENGFIHEEALAFELKGKYHHYKLQRRQAQYGIQNAYRVYSHWGNQLKTNQLKSEFADYIDQPNSIGITTTVVNTAVGTTGNAGTFDTASIIKASQLLAGEIVLSNLLEKLMQVVIENAAAQKGFLILNKAGQWFIEAQSDIDSHELKLLQSIPLDNDASDWQVAKSVVYYVIRSGENVVLDEAHKSERLGNDKYLQQNKVLSLLCMPLINQGKMSGILYLENNLSTNAFTVNRLEILKVLSTQMAVSIENAILYENLEEKVKERTLELFEQKEVIEEKNKQITASINYASRIQKAILLLEDDIKEALPNLFVFWKPRDIVSGDFYWIKKIQNKLVIVVADCTGHGVPGAFMSMLGIAFLNEIVRRPDVKHPSQTLDLLRDYIKDALQQTGKQDETKDGMDISLCFIDLDNHELEFAGAHNPLFIINKRERFEKVHYKINVEKQGLSLVEIAGDKMPVGVYLKERPFTNHRIKLEQGDVLYLFTDGFKDQHNDDGKKFYSKLFKQYLLTIADQPMEIQRQMLDETLVNWKGNNEQVDDITILGIKFS